MLQKVPYKELRLNPMTLFGEEWAALTAGNAERGYNSMCIAWGHLGALWERKPVSHARLPTAVVYVRPQRYTKEFMDREACFTIDFLGMDQRKKAGYLGAKSGRDEDKIAQAGLTPVFDEQYDTTYFAESRLVLVCKKLYAAPLVEEGFVDTTLVDGNYPARDFHTMYVGEIVKVLVRGD